MNFKTLQTYLPYLSGLLIILGVMYVNFYYSFFGITIEKYLNISELLLLFIDKKIFALFILCLSQFIIIKVILRAHKLEKIEKKKENGNSKKYSVTGIVIPLIIFMNILVFFFNSFELVYIQIIDSIIICFYIVILGIIDQSTTVIFDKKINRSYINWLIAFFLCIGTLYTMVLLEEKRINNGYYTGTTIFSKDSTYVSDAQHYYIGKTENYYFIYNQKQKSTLVIPEREVLKFELKFTPDEKWVDKKFGN